MKIVIVHPTRSRPDKVLETARKWMREVPDTDYSPADVEYHLGVEATERDLYRDTIIELSKEFGGRFHVRYLEGERLTNEQLSDPAFEMPKVHNKYLTAGTKCTTLIEDACFRADWFITVADDLHPCPEWERMMRETLNALKGTVAVVGYYAELIRKMVSHPVFTREFFEWNNRTFMNLEYVHTHADVDLWMEAIGAGVLHCFPPTVWVDHHHPALGAPVAWDDLYILNNHRRVYAQGETVFWRRKAELEAKYGRTFNLTVGEPA